MHTYRVKSRWANVHSGIVAVSPAVAAACGDRLEDLGDGTWRVVQPIQIGRGETFRHDGTMTATNVERIQEAIAPPAVAMPASTAPEPPAEDDEPITDTDAEDAADDEWPPPDGTDIAAETADIGRRGRGRPRKHK